MHDLDMALREMVDEREYSDQTESGDEASFEYEEALGEDSTYLGEVEEMELAGELLEVTSDEELEHFFGRLFRKIGKGVRKFSRPLTSVVKSVAKKALPMLGTAAGTFFGGPAGGALGANVGNMASKLFGLELEGLSPEDQEFEVARRVVRLAHDAAKQLAESNPGTDPTSAAKEAVLTAAARHAPGLAAAAGRGDAPAPSRGGQSGRWVRRGRSIVLLGL